MKDAAGRVHGEGKIGSTGVSWMLGQNAASTPDDRPGGDDLHRLVLRSLASACRKVKLAHPRMLRAIALAKKKNDRIDASKIADCPRCDFLPEWRMARTAIRDRRRVLRYRSLVIKQSVQMKNRVSGLLMETGGELQQAAPA